MPGSIIIGGGISGLSSAYYLAKAGAPSMVLESRPKLGGVIRTDRVEGCILEAGPDSFLSAKPAALDLIRDLGLSNQVIGSNDDVRVTFVRKRGRLVPLPDGLMMMVPTKIKPLLGTPLVGWFTKLRMGLELLRIPRRLTKDQSVSDFISDHYGREAVDYLAEPLLSASCRASSNWPTSMAASPAGCWPNAPRRPPSAPAIQPPPRSSARSKADWAKWWMAWWHRSRARRNSGRCAPRPSNGPRPDSA
jgi:oxygen-dependent protoporphyrinogen oxidase